MFKRQTFDLGLDLGTATTTVVAPAGVLYREPTCVAMRGPDVLAVGAKARKMMGRVERPTRVIRPVESGVVSDFESAQRMLTAILRRHTGRRWSRPAVLLAVSPDLSDVERRALHDCVRSAGVSTLATVPSPIALGLGADLPVRDPVGHAVADLGAGRISAAVLSLGGIVEWRAARAGADDIDEAIASWLRADHGLSVGARTLSMLKTQLGAAARVPDPARLRIRGRDLALGTPRELEVDANDVADACGLIVQTVQDILVDVLRHTPPELSSDLVEHGMIVSGGLARLAHMDVVLRQALGLPVVHLEGPAVATGLQHLLGDPDAADLLHRL